MPEPFEMMCQARKRAQINLERVIALTGATLDPAGYFLIQSRDGQAAFYVSSNWIIRAWDRSTTCYYLHPTFECATVPWQEKIATAMLSLYNNPRNFDDWFNRSRLAV